MKQVDEFEMAKSFVSGEESGFNYFFKKYYRSLTHFVYIKCRDMDMAKDFVSEAFITVWNKRSQIEPHPMTVRSWLYTYTRSKFSRYLQHERTKQKNESAIIYEYNVSPAEADRDLIRSETMRMVHEAIALLPEQCRKIIKMRKLEYLSVEEIQKELNLSKSTVKNQLNRGLEQLKKYIELGIKRPADKIPDQCKPIPVHLLPTTPIDEQIALLRAQRLSFKEIAKMLSMKISTVYDRYYRYLSIIDSRNKLASS